MQTKEDTGAQESLMSATPMRDIPKLQNRDFVIRMSKRKALCKHASINNYTQQIYSCIFQLFIYLFFQQSMFLGFKALWIIHI